MKNNHSTTVPKVDAANEDSRRCFIKGLTAMFGGAAIGSMLTSSSIAVAMAYVPKEDSLLSNGKIFNKAQLSLLKQICSIVIPKTDTLGAAEVDTHGFIDNQLFHCYSQAEQQRTVALINLIDNTAQKSYSTIFVNLNDQQKFQLLTELDLGKKPFNQNQRQDFKQVKQLICIGYYTSEVGATQELRYDPVPSGFKGSIPYKESDASWATTGLFY